ncbi:unnamed protein product [Adineta steineri]|uniref:Uncharacterized protein n=1 Tax=Adineta steineri TaxID=433720 RepID=A0A815SGJ3_9BILA|nr:unnamed protein product [Adineta steineri]CAF1492675.1 unnamed protein product [Adineta steineri]
METIDTNVNDSPVYDFGIGIKYYQCPVDFIQAPPDTVTPPNTSTTNGPINASTTTGTSITNSQTNASILQHNEVKLIIFGICIGLSIGIVIMKVLI